MSMRKIQVQIETERMRISGILQLPTEGYRSRVTDFLSGHETGFLASIHRSAGSVCRLSK